jgi:hypothetical protein
MFQTTCYSLTTATKLSAVEIFFLLLCCAAQTGIMQKTANLHCTTSHKSKEINFIFEENQL